MNGLGAGWMYAWVGEQARGMKRGSEEGSK